MLKKILTTVAVLALCAIQSKVAWATNPGDINLMLSTDGPDKYADGTPALNREYYALIWIKNGRSFAGMMTNGELVDPVNNVLVKKFRIATGYPNTFAGYIDSDNVHHGITQTIYAEEATKYAGGYFGLYLLDTRRFDASGAESIESLKSVNGVGLVQERPEGAGGQVEPTLVKIESTIPPAGATTAKIVSIIPATLVENPIVTVANTDDSIVYCIEYGSDIESIGDNVSVPQNGNSEQPISFEIPQCDADKGFFRVIRKK